MDHFRNCCYGKWMKVTVQVFNHFVPSFAIWHSWTLTYPNFKYLAARIIWLAFPWILNNVHHACSKFIYEFVVVISNLWEEGKKCLAIQNKLDCLKRRTNNYAMNSTDVRNPRRKLYGKCLCLSYVFSSVLSCMCKFCSRVSEPRLLTLRS